MARFVLQRAHVGSHEFWRLNWLSMEYRVTQLKLKHVHRISYNNAPEYLIDLFSDSKVLHTYNTRNSAVIQGTKV